MDRYDAEWKDLAPRDVVARSIHSEILRRGVSNVYLDLPSYIPVERIHAEFPEMQRSCLEYGIDITRDLLPVVPAAHYSCGGVWADEHGASTVQRLYAMLLQTFPALIATIQAERGAKSLPPAGVPTAKD